MYLSIEFQEEYKRLDRLCKDYLSSAEGVSEYIRQMESTSWRDRYYVHTWEDDYKKLKHIRWVRNQLAHVVGTLHSDICTKEDLEWTTSFYNRIINGSDPFTMIRKAQEEEERRSKLQARARKKIATESYEQTPSKISVQTPSKTSLWDRLIANIKSFFS